MIVFDSTFLLLLVHERVPVPKDPATGAPYEKGRERVEYLIDTISESNEILLVPTPVLAEVLTRAGIATPEYLAKIRSLAGFQIGDFDQRAAVELACMTGDALRTGRKRGPTNESPWQKVKFDRQIVAIAKVNGAKVIYSEDESLRLFAAAIGIKTHTLGELKLPPVKDQPDLPFEGDA